MNLGQLRDALRSRLQDTSKPYLWSDAELDSFINEAESEACQRARLIEDFDTPAITSLFVDTETTRYALDNRVLDIVRIEDEATGAMISGWTLTDTHVVFASAPASDATYLMHAVRLPLAPMVEDCDEPEINARHHYRMLDWACRCAYLKEDADAFDATAAEKAELRFIRSFGERFDANVARKHRRKTARTVAYNGM